MAVVVLGVGGGAGGPWSRLVTPHPAPTCTFLRGYQVGARSSAFAEEVWTVYPAAVGPGRISREGLGPWDVTDPSPSRISRAPPGQMESGERQGPEGACPTGLHSRPQEERLGRRPWPSSSFDDLDSHKSSKVNAIIMFCIGGAILLAMLILMAVVICLYYKVANALNMPKVPVCLALKNNPAMVSPDKVSRKALKIWETD
ncbi:hypothetical protein ABFV05_018444 [Capra hircus]